MEDFDSRRENGYADQDPRTELRRRLNRLAQVQTLIRNNSEGHLLQQPIEYFRSYWQAANSHIAFRLDSSMSMDQTQEELVQARLWLLRMVLLQDSRPHQNNISRLMRAAISKPAGSWSDIETLYMALTEHDHVHDSLRYALTIVLHYQYAESHADALARLQEHEDRRVRLDRKRNLPSPSREIILRRISHRLQSAGVESFTCAISIGSLAKESTDNTIACPVCQNEYLDFASFETEELIADYPVRIKYCGHILGKGCLEMWMQTPLPDPARYPNHTCPFCREDIEGVDPPTVPEAIQDHVQDNRDAMRLADQLGLVDEECWDALLGLLSEEIALEELEGHIKHKLASDENQHECLRRAQVLLHVRSKELVEEKKLWGFHCNQEIWMQAKMDWIRH